jgi:hypothetical protein
MGYFNWKCLWRDTYKKIQPRGTISFTKINILCSLIYGGNPPNFTKINESDYGILENKVLLFRNPII